MYKLNDVIGKFNVEISNIRKLVATIIDPVDGCEMVIESREITNSHWFAERVLNPDNTKDIFVTDNGCRVMIRSKKAGENNDGITGKVSIVVMDPLFGKIFDAQYTLLKEDEEVYKTFLERN